MNTCIVGFSKPKKFKLLSWLIRQAEHTKFSHTYVKLYDERVDKWIVYEASGMITHCCPEETFYLKNEVIQEVELTCASFTESEVLEDAIDSLALPYGMKQLLGLGLVRLSRLFGLKIKNPWSDGRITYVCSEYVGRLLQRLGYDVGDLDELTPKDIHELLNGTVSEA